MVKETQQNLVFQKVREKKTTIRNIVTLYLKAGKINWQMTSKVFSLSLNKAAAKYLNLFLWKFFDAKHNFLLLRKIMLDVITISVWFEIRQLDVQYLCKRLVYFFRPFEKSGGTLSLGVI